MNLRRYAIAALVVSCACSGAAQAQQELFSTISNREAFAAPGPLLQRVAADPANARIELVAADARAVHARQGALRMTLPGGIAIEAKQSRHQQMQSGNELWIGRVDMKPQGGNTSRLQPIDQALDEAILVRSGEELWGTIRVAGALYRLQPVDKGAHALIEVDQQAFPPDEHEEAYKEMVSKSQPVDFRSGSPLAAPKAISTIRVMVAFGPAARAAISNPQAAVDLAFAESNQALAATGTEIVFQQAGAIQNFSQAETTNYSTMLSRLTNLSDGFYDTIGSQRNSNTADIVAYVAPASSGLCGQAAGIATSNANAYFVMNPSCLSGNYTFVHEAAHVVGARHDNDPTLTPYAYGHGYVITSQNRRTVMAVNNGPCSTCTRIGAFSSPNFSVGGVPIGTATRNDNTRVWKTRGPTVAAFR